MLTDKAKKFIQKYQAGGVQGNITPAAPMYQQSSDTTLAATRNIGNQGIPFLSNWTKSVIGGWDFLQSFQDKKRQKIYEKQSQEEISKKYDQMRVNSFYKTPYGYKKGGLYQDGGLLDQAMKLQEKNDLGQFQNFFDFNNQSQLDQFNQLREDYQNKNLQKKNEWKNRMSTGLAEHIGAGAASFGEYMSTFGGGMGGGMQRGGFVTKDRMRRLLAPHYYSNYAGKDTNMGYIQGFQQGGYTLTTTNDPGIISTAQVSKVTPQDMELIRTQRLRELDLSSPSNQSEAETLRGASLLSRGIDPNEIKVGGPKKFRYREKQEGGEIDPTLDLYSSEFDPNKFLGIEMDKAEIEDKEHNSLMDWVFSDEGLESDSQELNDSYFESELPITPVVEKLRQLGLEPSSIEGGVHNIGSVHPQGKAVDLGLNTSFRGDAKKMDQFYEFLNSAEGKRMFPGIKIRDERIKPLNQRVWSGSHLHLEIE